MQFINLSKGWRTYATVAVGITVGVAQATGHPIPEWVITILGFAGLGFARAGINSQAQNATTALETLVQTILAQVAITPAPEPQSQPVTSVEPVGASVAVTTNTGSAPSSEPIELQKAVNNAGHIKV